MKSTAFKETNLNLGAGNNPNTRDLPVAISLHSEYPGVCFILSKWKMSEEERARFIETGELWLGVMARTQAPTQPPVFLTTDNPFDELGYSPLDPIDLMK